ncbi:MAG: DEAD/DEAH box helicase family protein, partial [Pseudomonadales bacterium]
MTTTDCPFCQVGPADVVWESSNVLALRDRFPVSPGHTLVITRAHRQTYFDALEAERAEIWTAVEAVKLQLDREFGPAGYNVGFNALPAAGQTVMHLHVHVIPRYTGDVPDPRGGVRGVIPGKQRYSSMPPLQIDRDIRDVTTDYRVDPFADLPAFVPGEESSFATALASAIHAAQAIDMVVAFVQPGGLRLIREDLRQALERGTHVRLLTGDYMNATSPDALRMLLALESEFPGRFVPSFFLGGGRRSFHAKAYIFVQGDHGIAFVGSSNLSHGALTDGIEWNLRTVSATQSEEFRAIRQRFERLLGSPDVQPLTKDLVDQYSERAPIPPTPDPRLQPLLPHPIQKEAMAALHNLRQDGARAGLVVMATGLGKTYLSALDFRQLGGKRALFIAHREEILAQAKDAWERIFPDRVLGMMVGDSHDPDADVIFASIQTLYRQQHLTRFDPDHFDYLVIDEIHHAAARTYRKVAGHFTPKFLLGLTATPDRMDGKSILDLCHDNLAYRAGLVRGIEAGLLVPFRYYGVRDSIDFEHIPWKGRWP